MITLKKNRLCAAALAAALVCSLCLPASASHSSFDDISSDTTAVNADILRLMGVVTGTGDNLFNPEGTLTRAEFCVMVTNFIQRSDEVARYAARTIFSDVTGKHWARGFINLMASPTSEGAAMIAGVGNGSFAPDQKVTVAQAVTVLLRVLGYTGKETGFIWPQSYMDLASSIGMLDGVPADAGTVLTRAQTAQLFVNALGCQTQSGQPYYSNLGNTAENIILLAVSVSSDDGSSNSAIRTSLDGEAFLPAAGNVAPTALQGKRGTLVLNEKEEIVTFLPDDSNSISVTLSGSAHPSYIKGTNGVRYTMSSSTLLYTADHAQAMNYIEGYTNLRTGSQLTLFTQSGKVIAVYAPGSTDVSDRAVIVSGKASEATFSRLTGGASNCAVTKNGQPITMAEINLGDVVTYDRLNNTLIVSDVRLKGVYEDVYPNVEAPQTITALGINFDVLDSTWEDMDDVKIGDTVCLLLTADGKVAGISKPSSNTQATAIGLVTENGVDVFLSNGDTLSVPGTISGNKSLAGRLVELKYRDKHGKMTVSLLSGSSSVGSFDVDTMTLGNLKVSAGVRIFDQVKSSVSVPISLADLSGQIIDNADISAYHTNTSKYVDCIVLNNMTGNAYSYGICKLELVEGEQYLTFENGVDPGVSNLQTPISFRNGQFSGLALSADGKAKSIISLEKLEDVSPTDFFDSKGSTYLEHEGQIYPVSDDVMCYKSANKLWFTNSTGSARLAACKAFSEELTAYYDPFVSQIRIVTAD